MKINEIKKIIQYLLINIVTLLNFIISKFDLKTYFETPQSLNIFLKKKSIFRCPCFYSFTGYRFKIYRPEDLELKFTTSSFDFLKKGKKRLVFNRLRPNILPKIYKLIKI